MVLQNHVKNTIGGQNMQLQFFERGEATKEMFQRQHEIFGYLMRTEKQEY